MVDAVLEIMQKAVVPWSNAVEKLVQQYLEMDGPKYVYDVLTLIVFHTILKCVNIGSFYINFFKFIYSPDKSF